MSPRQPTRRPRQGGSRIPPLTAGGAGGPRRRRAGGRGGAPRRGVARSAPLAGGVDGRGGAGEASLPPRPKRRGPPSSCLYSPECVEGKFSEVRLYRILGSSCLLATP